MSNYDRYPIEVHGRSLTLREYHRVDWSEVRARLRKNQYELGTTWTRFEEYAIDRMSSRRIRDRIKLREGEVLEIAQFCTPAHLEGLSMPPDENPVNEIGIKRIRQKKHSQKNGQYPEGFQGWSTWLRLAPPAVLSEKAQRHQDFMKKSRLDALREIEERRNRPPLTDAERWQMELDSVTPWEAKEMERERVRKLRQEWVDMRQNERENGPRLRAEAIRIQKERAAAGSPIKRRTS